MNILILNWRDTKHPKSGGAEIVTMNHATSWVRKGHSVTWLTSSYPNVPAQENYQGVNMIRKWGSLTVYLYVPWYLLFKSKSFDVVVDEVHGVPFFSPLFTKKPIVVFIHEIAGEIWNFMYPFPINIIGRTLEFFYFHLYKQCQFWTDAKSTIEELKKRGIPEEQCTAIPCPVSFEGVHVPVIEKKDTEPTYLFVSRVVRMKGIEEVIKAFSLIVKEQPTARLWIVGGGDEEYIEQLKTMMKEYGILERAVLWGRVSEEKKLALMSRAHILLHASVKEGWGLVVLEAAYMGTPSVVYNVPGLRDVVKNGKTGIVLRDNLPHEMASSAVTLFLDKKLYTQFQKNGKQWVSSLKWEDEADASMELLKKAVERVQVVS